MSWLTKRGQLGLQSVFEPDGQVIESDTCTCAHCNRAFAVGVRQRPEDIGGLCHGCWKPVCQKCVNEARDYCDPIEEKLKRWEDRDRFRRELG